MPSSTSTTAPVPARSLRASAIAAALSLGCSGETAPSTAPEPTLRVLFQGRAEGEIEPCG
jgi:hypothetical protein